MTFSLFNLTDSKAIFLNTTLKFIVKYYCLYLKKQNIIFMYSLILKTYSDIVYIYIYMCTVKFNHNVIIHCSFFLVFILHNMLKNLSLLFCKIQ